MTEETKCNRCGKLHAGTECPHCPRKVRIGMNEDRIRELLADGIYRGKGSPYSEAMAELEKQEWQDIRDGKRGMFGL